MATRTSDQTRHQVKLEMTHVSGGGEGRRANLRVFEEKSGLLILSVDIPPDEFYKLLSGLVDGTALPASLLTPSVYQRVGRTRYHWTRQIGRGVSQQHAEAWAADLMDRLTLDTYAINNRQGGLWATWELWTDIVDPETLDATRFVLNTTDLPRRTP